MTPEQADIIRAGVKAGDSCETIAKRIGYSEHTVRKWLKANGIKKWRKPRSQSVAKNHPFRIGLYGLAHDYKEKI